uniref:Cytochrome b n=1 Tax=Ihlea magalhanica TaxID=2781116 RepID=A0AA86M6G8_9UROC|nr:cytochrome b [Ihlea magalhanica]
MLNKVPLPQAINYFWNFGSMVGFAYTVQLISGIILSLRYYAGTMTESFNSIETIVREVEYGYMIRGFHLVGSQAMLLTIYLHMTRSIYYGRGANTPMTLQGAVILLVTMGAAFLGYVLPWGQMSFWGATVITGFLGVLPNGPSILEWVWGGFTVGHPTLTRFFSLHYLLGLAIMPLSLIHVLLLHEKGSGGPLGDTGDFYIPFWPYFAIKDLWPIMLLIAFMLSLVLFLMPETENLKYADPMVTPIHIKPEWYFLMFYAILRAVPSKVGGLLLMLMAIVILVVVLYAGNIHSISPVMSNVAMMFFTICIILTVLGGKPVEEPFLSTSMVMTILYFFFGLLLTI